MFHLLYVSVATEAFSQANLESLLAQARERNARLNVTGILLYKAGNFIQLLEGEEDVVMALYYRIMLDPKHKKVVTLIKDQVKTREFENWSMGYRNLDDPSVASLPGYNDFMYLAFTPEELNSDVSRCKRLLALFKNN